MGIYRNYIFPYMLELSLGGQHPTERRRQALEESRGDVLEIGFGTGLNLACYPRSIARLTLLDSEKLLPKRVAKRIEAAGFAVEMAQLDAAQLPFESERFDTVVSTWTLCTIPDVASALAEVRRVLKPGGSLLFLEHGLSSDPRIARRQDRWNPVQRFIGLGCNLNRPIDTLIASAGLTIERLDRFLMPYTQRIAADHYLGSARRD